MGRERLPWSQLWIRRRTNYPTDIMRHSKSTPQTKTVTCFVYYIYRPPVYTCPYTTPSPSFSLFNAAIPELELCWTWDSTFAKLRVHFLTSRTRTCASSEVRRPLPSSPILYQTIHYPPNTVDFSLSYLRQVFRGDFVGEDGTYAVAYCRYSHVDRVIHILSSPCLYIFKEKCPCVT